MRAGLPVAGDYRLSQIDNHAPEHPAADPEAGGDVGTGRDACRGVKSEPPCLARCHSPGCLLCWTSLGVIYLHLPPHLPKFCRVKKPVLNESPSSGSVVMGARPKSCV